MKQRKRTRGKGVYVKIGRVDARHQIAWQVSRNNYGPIMVHESLPPATSYTLGSHPRRVFSIRYVLTGYFYSDNSCSIVGEHVENSGKLWRVAALATKAALWVR